MVPHNFSLYHLLEYVVGVDTATSAVQYRILYRAAYSAALLCSWMRSACSMASL
jgi:hypothetical protein